MKKIIFLLLFSAHLFAQITPGGGNVTGTGTTNYIPLWTSASRIGNSYLYQSGNNVVVPTGKYLSSTGGTGTLDFNFGSTPGAIVMSANGSTLTQGSLFTTNVAAALIYNFFSGSASVIQAESQQNTLTANRIILTARNDSIRFNVSTKGANKVWTSDANGYGTWQTPSGGISGATGQLAVATGTNTFAGNSNLVFNSNKLLGVNNTTPAGLLDVKQSNGLHAFCVTDANLNNYSVIIGNKHHTSTTECAFIMTNDSACRLGGTRTSVMLVENCLGNYPGQNNAKDFAGIALGSTDTVGAPATSRGASSSWVSYGRNYSGTPYVSSWFAEKTKWELIGSDGVIYLTKGGGYRAPDLYYRRSATGANDEVNIGRIQNNGEFSFGYKTPTTSTRLYAIGFDKSASHYVLELHDSTGTNNMFMVNNAGNIGLNCVAATGVGSYRFDEVNNVASNNAGYRMTTYLNSAAGNNVIFARSANGTLASPTSTASGDGLFTLGVQGYTTVSGTNLFKYAGNLNFECDGAVTATTVPGRITFKTSSSAAVLIEAMRINSSQNVGIGTTTISARLHLISTTEQLRVGYDASNYYSTTVGSTGGVTLDAVGSGAAFTFSDKVINSSTVRLKNYTVATLPAGTQGDFAYVTDALAPTYGATVAGGGAIVTPVFYDGTNWTCR